MYLTVCDYIDCNGWSFHNYVYEDEDSDGSYLAPLEECFDLDYDYMEVYDIPNDRKLNARKRNGRHTNS